MRKLSRACVTLLLSSLLCGCTKYVYLPVWSCQEPTMPVEQPLRTSGITDKDSTDTILKGFIYDITYLKSLNEQYRVLLQGYSTKGKTMPSLLDGLVPCADGFGMCKD